MSSLRRSLRRLESWLWTGPAGHLAGGALDFWTALLGYAAARRREAAEARGMGGAQRSGGAAAHRHEGAAAPRRG